MNYENPYQLLIATILSAQTTDVRVNQITPRLFTRYPVPLALAESDLTELALILRPLGFQNRRAKQLVNTAKQIVEEFGGEVPENLKDLQKLSGVGRKTAHVVMGNCFGASAFTVDTHVARLSARLGYSSEKTPLKIEYDLQKHFSNQIFPSLNWTHLSHQFITHGRGICQAKKPECGQCFLQEVCPSAVKN